MSTMNGLQLAETDEEIHTQGLNLTELEGALHPISENIPTTKIKMDSIERQSHQCPN